MTDTANAAAIARGRNVPWEYSIEHPEHGTLTFHAKLPLASRLLEHAVETDNRLAGIQVSPTNATYIFASAMAALTAWVGEGAKPGEGVLVNLPVVEEERTEQDGRVEVKRRFYDVDAELDPAFIVSVWTAFSSWRQEQISPEMVRAVGKSSGATTSSDSSESSIEPTEPPATIPAS